MLNPFFKGAIGGGVGILATGQFLNINSRFYLDSFKKQNTLSTQSSNWIGCWWYVNKNNKNKKIKLDLI